MKNKIIIIISFFILLTTNTYSYTEDLNWSIDSDKEELRNK